MSAAALQLVRGSRVPAGIKEQQPIDSTDASTSSSPLPGQKALPPLPPPPSLAAACVASRRRRRRHAMATSCLLPVIARLPRAQTHTHPHACMHARRAKARNRSHRRRAAEPPAPTALTLRLRSTMASSDLDTWRMQGCVRMRMLVSVCEAACAVQWRPATAIAGAGACCAHACTRAPWPAAARV